MAPGALGLGAVSTPPPTLPTCLHGRAARSGLATAAPRQSSDGGLSPAPELTVLTDPSNSSSRLPNPPSTCPLLFLSAQPSVLMPLPQNLLSLQNAVQIL